MSQPTNTFSSYDAIGNEEDVADVIYNISPTQTPFLSGIKKTTATAVTHEWQTDSLAAADADNHRVEGQDAETTASTPTVLVNNKTQISDKVPQVSGTQRSNASYGRGDEMDYQVAKHGKEMKRDVETILLNNRAKAGGDDTTARELAGVESWIATNTSAGVGGADPTGDGTDARTDGTQRAFLESDLKGVLRQCADEGGEPDTISVGTFNKQAASAFSGNATRTTDSTDQALHTAVHVYVSDFGELKIEFNRFQRARSALVLDLAMWGFATLRDWMTWDLAKTGDTTRKQLLVEYTLESNQEAASGIVADLTTS